MTGEKRKRNREINAICRETSVEEQVPEEGREGKVLQAVKLEACI